MSSSAPTVRRRRLAGELRQLREHAGMTLDDAAAAAEISKSALSRIENSLVGIKIPVLRALAHAYQVPSSEIDRLVEIARYANQRGWWLPYADVLTSAGATYVGFEAEANAIRAYEGFLVPGLLQTVGYIEAVYGEIARVTSSAEIERLVEVRKRRQQRLEEIEFLAIVEESVLLRPVGSVDAMLEQLSHLANVSERLPGVTIQILPLEVGLHVGSEGPFTILEYDDPNDPNIVFIESIAGHAFLDKPEDIRRVDRIFNNLRSVALSPRQSQQRIKQELEKYN